MDSGAGASADFRTRFGAARTFQASCGRCSCLGPTALRSSMQRKALPCAPLPPSACLHPLKVRIGDLLAAAGVHLDQECGRCSEFNITGEKAMLRNVGVELEITLFYTNLWLSWQDPATWLLPAKEPSFELKVAARQPIEGVRTLRSIPAAQSYFDLEDGQKESARVTRRSHGIRLLFRQQGVLGVWDSMALAYFLLQSCTFLGVAWTLTELLCSIAPLLCGFLRWPVPAWYDCLQPATDVPTTPKKKMQ
ncbi:unnamed protein product [Symbiodinium sp. CCMP2592]|nr:unnamed protein product [Symbiodinium sp. CCMP2592]